MQPFNRLATFDSFFFFTNRWKFTKFPITLSCLFPLFKCKYLPKTKEKTVCPKKNNLKQVKPSSFLTSLSAISKNPVETWKFLNFPTKLLACLPVCLFAYKSNNKQSALYRPLKKKKKQVLQSFTKAKKIANFLTKSKI